MCGSLWLNNVPVLKKKMMKCGWLLGVYSGVYSIERCVVLRQRATEMQFIFRIGMFRKSANRRQERIPGRFGQLCCIFLTGGVCPTGTSTWLGLT